MLLKFTKISINGEIIKFVDEKIKHLRYELIYELIFKIKGHYN